jgi:hypothetical protein
VKVYEPDVENFLTQGLLKRMLNVGFILLFNIIAGQKHKASNVRVALFI